jgi:hypothetical protein
MRGVPIEQRRFRKSCGHRVCSGGVYPALSREDRVKMPRMNDSKPAVLYRFTARLPGAGSNSSLGSGRASSRGQKAMLGLNRKFGEVHLFWELM